MKDPTRLLHVAYWSGAILDGLTVVPLLVPSAAGAMFGIRGFAPGSDFRYAAAVGAALMAGWTALLVWGDRRPVERRGVLALTVVPVLAGLVAAGVYAVGSDLVGLAHMVPTFVLQVVVSTLFVTAYVRATAYARGGKAYPRSPAT